jgi:hypothetical protein
MLPPPRRLLHLLLLEVLLLEVLLLEVLLHALLLLHVVVHLLLLLLLLCHRVPSQIGLLLPQHAGGVLQLPLPARPFPPSTS